MMRPCWKKSRLGLRRRLIIKDFNLSFTLVSLFLQFPNSLFLFSFFPTTSFFNAFGRVEVVGLY